MLDNDFDHTHCLETASATHSISIQVIVQVSSHQQESVGRHIGALAGAFQCVLCVSGVLDHIGANKVKATS